MADTHNNESFSYTYSAKEQDEIKRIRSKYIADKTEDKMEQLRKLDERVTQKITVIALIIGIAGTLLLGVGMCCCLVWSTDWFIPGIIIGIVGIAIMAATLPIYQHILKKEREKIAPEIIRLTDELIK